MTALIAPDVSHFQNAVDDRFNRRWLTFRVCDGDYRDHNAAQNLAWAVKARAAGKLTNFAVYAVYRPGENSSVLAALAAFGVPRDCVVMVDVESWSGQIRGNHSDEITALATALVKRQGGRSDLVWCYANRGDFDSVYPQRPKWLHLVIAAYSAVQPPNPGPGPLVGWQYSDGDTRWPVPSGYPRSSDPFGHCDHNVIFTPPLPTASAVHPSVPEDDMPLSDHDVQRIAAAVWQQPIKYAAPGTGKPHTAPAATWLAYGANRAGRALGALRQHFGGKS